jgi:hypothetical protein
LVEVDLYWDQKIETHKLGFGIYRSTNGGSFVDVAFLRDPLADFFAYAGSELTTGNNYSFAVTAIDTLFDGVDGESALSTAITISPLGDLLNSAVSAGTSPLFTWSPASGADSYQVFVYDELPSIGVNPITTSPNLTTTSWNYSGSLLRGKQYWFVVIGSNSYGDKSVGELRTFIP